MGSYVLGILAGLLAVWFMIQAADGLGYAFPRHPTAIDPARSRTAAQILAALVVIGLVISLAVPFGMGQGLVFRPFHIVVGAALLLPIWELVAAEAYRGTILVVNAEPEATRPAVIAAVSEVFGEIVDDTDMLVAADWEGDDFRIHVNERARLIVLRPTFRLAAGKAHQLFKALEARLKAVKAAGFNERSFWMAFVAPLALTVLYAGVAFILFNTKGVAGLRGTLGF